MHDSNGLDADTLEQVKKCAAALTSGGIVAYPTDTVYGLGADIFNESAVKKIYTVKGRPFNLPLPVLIADLSRLKDLAADVPASAERLITAFWPGALTLVFNRAPTFSSAVLAGQSKVAVRMPAHAITLQLIKEAGCPIVGTSANLHGSPALLTAAEVREQIGASLDCVLDGGPCPGGTESTIVDITAELPQILRKGAIRDKEIQDMLN
jgi:L-threonylcarbamoyladenylate synthase